MVVVQRLVIEAQEKEWRFEEKDPPLKWIWRNLSVEKSSQGSQVCRWKRVKRTVVVSLFFYK